MPTRRASRLLALLAVLSLPPSTLLAEDRGSAASPRGEGQRVEVKRETLKVPGAKQAEPSRAQMLATAREVTRGYYHALIAAKYDEAASFLHPSAIEPLRARVLADLEKSPEAKTKNTLGALGVKDLNALRTMSLDAFYVSWAKSPYGQGVQVLAQEDLAVDVILDPPTCSPKDRVCQVDLKLRARKDDGSKMESPSTVWVLEHEGRWLLTNLPPR